MIKARIIPCLLLHDGGLVKTVKFKSPKYVGDPINAVRIFNNKGVDELVFLDIDASKENRGPDLRLIADLASECFMPFAYGGGVTSVEMIRTILGIGVEKVVLNQSALKDLSFVKSAVAHFGSSTILVAIDVKKDFWGNYKVYNHVSRKTIMTSPFEYAKHVQEAGAGEIFLNDVDRDGTYEGLNIELISKVNSNLQIPLVACGGASGLENIAETIKVAKVGAVAAGSMFVYQGPHRAVLISYPSRKDLIGLDEQMQ